MTAGATPSKPPLRVLILGPCLLAGELPFFVPGIAHPGTAWKRRLFGVFIRSLARIAAIPWVVNRFDDGNKEDFSLPHYSSFEERGRHVGQ